jgi:hypothetical protein
MTNEELKCEIEALNYRIVMLEVTVANLNTTLFNVVASNDDDNAFRARVVEAVKKTQPYRLV